MTTQSTLPDLLTILQLRLRKEEGCISDIQYQLLRGCGFDLKDAENFKQHYYKAVNFNQWNISLQKGDKNPTIIFSKYDILYILFEEQLPLTTKNKSLY